MAGPVSVRLEARPAFGEQAEWKHLDLASPRHRLRPADAGAG